LFCTEVDDILHVAQHSALVGVAFAEARKVLFQLSNFP
jgi:hypothetical protein